MCAEYLTKSRPLRVASVGHCWRLIGQVVMARNQQCYAKRNLYAFTPSRTKQSSLSTLPFLFNGCRGATIPSLQVVSMMRLERDAKTLVPICKVNINIGDVHTFSIAVAHGQRQDSRTWYGANEIILSYKQL